jgi:hypothetical protein
MKKALFILSVICGTLMAVSCDRNNKDNPSDKTYIDTLIEDYHELVSKYPRARESFVEARYTLNGIISKTAPEDLKAESVELYCCRLDENNSIIYVFSRNFKTGQTGMDCYTIDTPWLDNYYIRDSDLKRWLTYSIEDAIDIVTKDKGIMAGDGLNTRLVTLRQSAREEWEYPRYEFSGDNTRTIYVDAFTGKIKKEK